MQSLSRAGRFFAFAAMIFTSHLAEADEPLRTWQDRTGRFEVRAKLVKQTDASVKLRKEDGRIVDVPISVLSQSDQKYLKDRTDSNPFAGGVSASADDSRMKSNSASGGASLSDTSSRVLSVGGKSIFIKVNDPAPAIPPDPAPASPNCKPFTRLLPNLDRRHKLSRPVLLDPARSLFAVSAFRPVQRDQTDANGRIYLLNADSKNAEVPVDMGQTIVLHDHHAASGRSLAAVGVKDSLARGGDLCLIDQLVSGKPAVVGRWRFPNEVRSDPEIKFARLLDAKRAVVMIDNQVHVWDLETGASVLTVPDTSYGLKIEISRGGRLLAIPVSGGCQLVDLEKGELVGKIEMETKLSPQVSFSPNGRLLAMTAGNDFRIWDFTKAEEFSSGTLGDLTGDNQGWIDDEHLLTTLGGLVDCELGISLWKYNMPTGNLTRIAPGGIAVLNQLPDKVFSFLPLPHSSCKNVMKTLASSQELTTVHEGTEVSMKIEGLANADLSKVEPAMRTAVQAAGWKLNPQSAIQLIVSVRQGEKQVIGLQALGGRGGALAVVQPNFVNLEVRQQNTSLWKKGPISTLPYVMRLHAGESVQQVIKRCEEIDPKFFAELKLPSKIIRGNVDEIRGHSMVAEGEWKDYTPRGR